MRGDDTPGIRPVNAVGAASRRTPNEYGYSKRESLCVQKPQGLFSWLKPKAKGNRRNAGELKSGREVAQEA